MIDWKRRSCHSLAECSSWRLPHRSTAPLDHVSLLPSHLRHQSAGKSCFSLLFFSLIYTFKTFLFAYLQFLLFLPASLSLPLYQSHSHAGYQPPTAHTHSHSQPSLSPLPLAFRQWTNFCLGNCAVLYTCLLLILPCLSFSFLMSYYCNYCHYVIFCNELDWCYCYGTIYSLQLVQMCWEQRWRISAWVMNVVTTSWSINESMCQIDVIDKVSLFFTEHLQHCVKRWKISVNIYQEGKTTCCLSNICNTTGLHEGS